MWKILSFFVGLRQNAGFIETWKKWQNRRNTIVVVVYLRPQQRAKKREMKPDWSTKNGAVSIAGLCNHFVYGRVFNSKNRYGVKENY